MVDISRLRDQNANRSATKLDPIARLMKDEARRNEALFGTSSRARRDMMATDKIAQAARGLAPHGAIASFFRESTLLDKRDGYDGSVETAIKEAKRSTTLLSELHIADKAHQHLSDLLREDAFGVDEQFDHKANAPTFRMPDMPENPAYETNRRLNDLGDTVDELREILVASADVASKQAKLIADLVEDNRADAAQAKLSNRIAIGASVFGLVGAIAAVAALL